MWYDKDISKLLFLKFFFGVIVFRNGNREKKKEKKTLPTNGCFFFPSIENVAHGSQYLYCTQPNEIINTWQFRTSIILHIMKHLCHDNCVLGPKEQCFLIINKSGQIFFFYWKNEKYG